MILAAKGKDKKSRKQLKQVFKKKKYFFLLRFYQFSSKHELHSVQNGYTPSPALGVQN
jgi:hypothetical protein